MVAPNEPTPDDRDGRVGWGRAVAGSNPVSPIEKGFVEPVWAAESVNHRLRTEHRWHIRCQLAL
jgi:hypothetical protein